MTKRIKVFTQRGVRSFLTLTEDDINNPAETHYIVSGQTYITTTTKVKDNSLFTIDGSLQGAISTLSYLTVTSPKRISFAAGTFSIGAEIIITPIL